MNREKIIKKFVEEPKIICNYCNIEIFDVYDNNIDQPEFGIFIHKKCAIDYFNKLGSSICSYCDYDYSKNRFICRNTCLEINDAFNVYSITTNIKYKNTYWHKNCFIEKYF